MNLPEFSVQLSGDWKRTLTNAVFDWTTAMEMARQMGATHFLEERVRDNRREYFYEHGQLVTHSAEYFVTAVAFLRDIKTDEHDRQLSATQVGMWTRLGLDCVVDLGPSPRGYVTPIKDAALLGAKIQEIAKLKTPCLN